MTSTEREVEGARRLPKFVALRVCLVDVALFVVSYFAFPWGADGPMGPTFVLRVLNFPVWWVAAHLFPLPGRVEMIALPFVTVVLNGFLYGLVGEWWILRRGRARQKAWGAPAPGRKPLKVRAREDQ
jgi:hypothetical protein